MAGNDVNSGPNAPIAPTVNPGYQTVLQGQESLANTFRNNLPGYSQQLGDQYQQQQRQQLASNLKATDSNYNSRGLLYSGARVGNEVGQQAQSASDIASGKQQINQGLLNQANQLDTNAFNTAVGIANTTNTGAYQVQTQADVEGLANQISNTQAQTQALGGLLGGLSSAAGLGVAMSGLGSPSTPEYQNTGTPATGGGLAAPGAGVPMGYVSNLQPQALTGQAGVGYGAGNGVLSGYYGGTH